jgi:hypothetical protein
MVISGSLDALLFECDGLVPPERPSSSTDDFRDSPTSGGRYPLLHLLRHPSVKSKHFDSPVSLGGDRHPCGDCSAMVRGAREVVVPTAVDVVEVEAIERVKRDDEIFFGDEFF